MTYTAPPPSADGWLNPQITAYRSDGGAGAGFLSDTFPRLYTTPSLTTPDWIAFDISAVTSRTPSLRLFYNNQPQNQQYDTTNSASYSGLPGTYLIQTNTAPGGSPPPTTGWQSVITETNSTLSEHLYTLNGLSGVNWVRMYVTALAPTEQQRWLSGSFDFYDGLAPADSGAFFMGDSITLLSAGHNLGADGHGSYWSYALHAKESDPTDLPLLMADGIGGTPSSRCTGGDADRDLAAFPGRFFVLAFGMNDANSGLVAPATYYAHMKACVDKVLAAGKVPIIPTISWTSDPQYMPYIPALNQQIYALYAQYNGQVLAGPDFYDYFYLHPFLLRNPSPTATDVHPNTQGVQAMELLWENWFLQTIYGVNPTALYPDPN